MIGTKNDEFLETDDWGYKKSSRLQINHALYTKAQLFGSAAGPKFGRREKLPK